MNNIKTKPQTGDIALEGEIIDPHPEPGSASKYFRVLDDAMDQCTAIARANQTSDPKLAVAAYYTAGRLAQAGLRMTHEEERMEWEREDHDDKHLRLMGRTKSPHARVRQARAERRLILREEHEIKKNTPEW